MVDRSQIRQHMNVLGSDGEPLGKVDEIDGDRLKLTKDASPDGRHHYASLADVARVEGETVHLGRTRAAILGSAAGAAGGSAGHASPLPEIKNPAVSSSLPRRNYMLPWVLGALVLIALIALLTQYGHHDGASKTTTTTTQATVTPRVAGAPLRNGTLAYQLDQFLSSTDGLPRTFTLDDVNFDTGSATLREADLTGLDDVARVFAAYPDARAAIVGFTDAQGAPSANRSLGADRARAVVTALQQRGVDPSRFDVRTGGQGAPVAPNATPSGRSQNRRTELIVLKR